MDRVLITGANGFIARNLISKLRKSDKYEVFGIDKSEFRDPEPNFSALDLLNPRLVEHLQNIGPDIVIHLAAQTDVRFSIEDPEFDWKNNVQATRSLISAISALNRDVSIVYANSGGATFDQSRGLPVNEEGQINAISPYGKHKHQASLDLNEFASSNKNINLVTLNLSNVFGYEIPPKSAPAIFLNLIAKKHTLNITGDGSITRDWVFIDDVTNAFISSFKIRGIHNFNISSNTQCSLNELVHMCEEILHLDAHINYLPNKEGEVHSSQLDNSKAKKLLDWSPQINLRSGLNLMKDFYGL